MADGDRLGHREKLREGFLAEDDLARSDESLPEMLLSYAIPQEDVRRLAGELLTRFGGLSGVLGASREASRKCDCIKSYASTLIKLADRLRTSHPGHAGQQDKAAVSAGDHPSLFPSDLTKPTGAVGEIPPSANKPVVVRRGT
jgi:DNA repair protein RadC